MSFGTRRRSRKDFFHVRIYIVARFRKNGVVKRSTGRPNAEKIFRPESPAEITDEIPVYELVRADHVLPWEANSMRGGRDKGVSLITL